MRAGAMPAQYGPASRVQYIMRTSNLVEGGEYKPWSAIGANRSSRLLLSATVAAVEQLVADEGEGSGWSQGGGESSEGEGDGSAWIVRRSAAVGAGGKRRALGFPAQGTLQLSGRKEQHEEEEEEEEDSEEEEEEQKDGEEVGASRGVRQARREGRAAGQGRAGRSGALAQLMLQADAKRQRREQAAATAAGGKGGAAGVRSAKAGGGRRERASAAAAGARSVRAQDHQASDATSSGSEGEGQALAVRIKARKAQRGGEAETRAVGGKGHDAGLARGAGIQGAWAAVKATQARKAAAGAGAGVGMGAAAGAGAGAGGGAGGSGVAGAQKGHAEHGNGTAGPGPKSTHEGLARGQAVVEVKRYDFARVPQLASKDVFRTEFQKWHGARGECYLVGQCAGRGRDGQG